MSNSLIAGAQVIVGLIAFVAAFANTPRSFQAQGVAIDADDIGGVVSGRSGPEAGVWVIAETTDLPTKFVRIVVTDDRGRYVIPDLPSATYSVWVRGYGLVDSEKSRSTRGRQLNLTAVAAPNAKAAAQYFPAGYWFSLLNVPAASEFPGTGASGNGLATSLTSQATLLRNLKSGGCMACHGLGNKATREISPALGSLRPNSRTIFRAIRFCPT